MDIMALGAIGEFVGSIAVLVTLVYLALQLKQTKEGIEANTLAVVGASEVSGNENTMRATLAVAQDADLAEIIQKGYAGSKLARDDYVRFHNFVHGSFQLHQITFLQWKKKLLDDEYWGFCIRYFGDNVLKQEGVHRWWKRNGALYTQQYRELIDTLIQDRCWLEAVVNRGSIEFERDEERRL